MDATVWALAFDSAGNLYAGGVFNDAGGVNVMNVAKWSGGAWSVVGSGGNLGLDGNVEALAFDSAGNLYAGGNFAQTADGSVTLNNVAKWDGTNWTALGTGTNNTVIELAFDGVGNLYAGGEFTTAGGVSANRIAKWDGANWSALGTGMDNDVLALAYDGAGYNLYAGGFFDTAGGVTVNKVAKWDLYNPPPAPTPTVADVTSSTESGSYPIGSVITITIRFDYLVWVKGMPQLVLNTGGAAPGMAYYSSGSGTKILIFQYTVTAVDDITKLDYWSEWALELNGGQIYSNQGIVVDLDLPAPGTPGSLGYNNALGILGVVHPVYRFYSPGLLKHFFTVDENEKEYLIANAADVWQFEYGAYYAYLPQQYNAASRLQKSTLQAVHRFYSEALQTHLFTIDENEKEYLIANGADVWQYEGPAFYVPATNLEGTIPVYRFYSDALKVHLYTVDENEKNHLINTAGDVWRYEGIAYYAYP